MATPNPDVLTFEAMQVQIEQDRQKRIAEHKASIVARGVSALALEARGAGMPLNILAEGDSWFDYPLFRDTIGWIQSDGTPQPLMLNLAHYGDVATQMLGVAQRQCIIENLTDPGNGKFDALLFSAGGNDIAGDQFCLWVTQFFEGADPDHGIDRQRLADMIGVIDAALVDLIQVRDAYAPHCIIFLHAYDFARPTGRGVCGVGPWLKPSLDFRGWTDPTQAAEIVKQVLLLLDRLLVQIEQRYKESVVYVRTQGTLSPATDWSNELHPTEQGFRKIAGIFLKSLRKKFPGRI
jgi:hypothetical protein